MVLHGFPSFFGATIILVHHSTGLLIGTGLMVLLAIYSLRLCSNFSIQCNGIGIGTSPTLKWIWAGLVDTYGKCVDLLKAVSFTVWTSFNLAISVGAKYFF